MKKIVNFKTSGVPRDKYMYNTINIGDVSKRKTSLLIFRNLCVKINILLIQIKHYFKVK